MYICERCGTRFGRRTATVESCPRCLARDGIRVALAFSLFEDRRPGGSGARSAEGLERAVRRELASGTR